MDLPTTELDSAPKAQIQRGPCGMENLTKLHWLEKYLGIIGSDDSRALLSSKLKTCMVPWSDATTIIVDWWLKLMQNMFAWLLPRRSSDTFLPFSVSKMRIRVPFSPAVAKRVPCKFNAMQLMAASCAITSNGARSVLARSTICTWPVRRPGNASRLLLLCGHKTHKPLGLELVSNTCSCCGCCVNVYTLMMPSSTTTIRSRLRRTARTGWLKSRVMAGDFLRSSQTITLLGGYRGRIPPPTSAR